MWSWAAKSAATEEDQDNKKVFMEKAVDLTFQS
jgi:hypothetical protein